MEGLGRGGAAVLARIGPARSSVEERCVAGNDRLELVTDARFDAIGPAAMAELAAGNFLVATKTGR